MAIPLQIISGFLGAGKTSAVRAQLEQPRGQKIAVIVNDFGEASLDEIELSEGKPFRITNIAGACVCCTAPEGFIDALGALLDGDPDRIFIEPTGLARPQDLIDTVRRSPHRERIELAPVVVLVDPAQLADDRAGGGSLFREQVEAADILVANRTDLCAPDDLERFASFARELWPPPLAVQHTTFGRLGPELLEWPEGEGERLPRAAGARRRAHDHSTGGFVARSWQWAPELVFSRERLTSALARLATGRAGAPLARFKGIFRTQEGVYRLECAGDRVDERPSSFRRDSRVDVVLQSDSEAPLATVGEWLESALLAEAELRLSSERIEVVVGDGRVHVVDRQRLLGLDDPVEDVSVLFPDRRGAAARVRALWQALELPDRADVVVVAGDGFASEPVAASTLCEGVLLHSLEDEALPPEKGGPFRLLIPEKAGAPLGGCANVKGVAKLVLR